MIQRNIWQSKLIYSVTDLEFVFHPCNFVSFRMAEEENQELDEETLKARETVIMDIGKKFRDDGNAKELENMIKMIRPFTKLLSKAKAAKLIRGLVDMYLDMETGGGVSSTRAVQVNIDTINDGYLFINE